MATKWVSYPVEFKGGLISNMNALEQGLNAPGSATILQNYEPSKEGGYKKVLGYTKASDTLVPGTGPILGVVTLPDTSILAARANSPTNYKVYRLVGTSWVEVASKSGPVDQVIFYQYNLGAGVRFMITDGVNSPYYFDYGSLTVTAPTYNTDIVGSDHFIEFREATFFANGSVLIYSAPGSDTDFTSASGGGIINIGDEITGLASFREQLIIFSKSKIKKLVGSSAADYALTPITDSLGCIARDTIQEVGGDIMFMGPDGFRLLSATEREGDFGLGVASAAIPKDALSLIRSSTKFSSLVLRDKAQYRILAYQNVNEDSAQGLIATKFSDQGSEGMQWATLRGFKVYCSDSRYVLDREYVVFGNDTGYVYKLEFGSTRDGGIIEAIYKSPHLIVDDPQVRKTLYKLGLHIDTTGATELEGVVDYDIYKTAVYTGSQTPTFIITGSGSGVFYGQPSTVYGVAVYGAAADKIYDTNLVGSGKTFSLRLYDYSTNPSYSLQAAVFELRSFDRK